MSTETYTNPGHDPLLWSGRVLTVLMQGFLALGAAATLIALPFVVFFQDTINAEILAEQGEMVNAFPAIPIALAMILILGMLALAFKFFGKLRQIINSVGDGDPFAPENADRLNAMGWFMLTAYAIAAFTALIGTQIAPWARELEDADFEVSIGIDLTAILTVVLLFILARVFRHGAAMRDDLEGTV